MSNGLLPVDDWRARYLQLISPQQRHSHTQYATIVYRQPPFQIRLRLHGLSLFDRILVRPWRFFAASCTQAKASSSVHPPLASESYSTQSPLRPPQHTDIPPIVILVWNGAQGDP